MNVPPKDAPDYRGEYNEYWKRPDRAGESSADLEAIADQIVSACDRGSVLDIGCGEGVLVSALVRRGLDAKGVDVSDVVIARCNHRIPGRFHVGSVLALPFGDESVDTIVSTDCLEHLAPADIPAALAEMYRVARRSVYLRIATTPDRDDHWHLTVEGRAWWEGRCFEAGFRKHPGYYRVNDYEALNHDGWQIGILLEKVPQSARLRYPLEVLQAERGLHMDMLRDTGERSDAHVIRYQWACDYVKPGDRVLDAACGLGYGGRIVEHLSLAESILGIDASAFAVEYATASYASPGWLEYRQGLLPAALSAFPDGSFDTILSFETLEHVEDPTGVLDEFCRLLTPGGRVVVSVPNDWSDHTGLDPNPHHLHVYDFDRLRSELGRSFIVEEAFAQTASQAKTGPDRKSWERRSRSLRNADLATAKALECEWWLMTAMKTPLQASAPYRERAFANVANSGHPSIEYAGAYASPWLMHAMVNLTYRLRNGPELERLAAQVMVSSPPESNDYAAALCVRAYRLLGRRSDSKEMQDAIVLIDALVASPPPGPMGLRWKTSLLFIKAKLLLAAGRRAEAHATFQDCGRQDVRPFGIHLATRVTEAWFQAGTLALADGDLDTARADWKEGIACGNALLSVALDDILIDPGFPNRFNYGDGVREYAVAWDNIARCANGVHLLARGGRVDAALLEVSFQAEYRTVVGSLHECRDHLDAMTDDVVSVRKLLTERTENFERAGADLQARTDELVETRKALVERTGELVETRATLAERTQMLERASVDLVDRTDDLIRTRAELEERTRMLESTISDLPEAARELVMVRPLLEQRNGELEQARSDLRERTGQFEVLSRDLDTIRADLIDVRGALLERSSQLATANRDVIKRTDELVETRATLQERTRTLEATSRDLAARTKELVETRTTLQERTGNLEVASHDLAERTADLVRTREVLEERTTRLEAMVTETQELARALENANAALREILAAPLRYGLKAAFRRFLK